MWAASNTYSAPWWYYWYGQGPAYQQASVYGTPNDYAPPQKDVSEKRHDGDSSSSSEDEDECQKPDFGCDDSLQQICIQNTVCKLPTKCLTYLALGVNAWIFAYAALGVGSLINAFVYTIINLQTIPSFQNFWPIYTVIALAFLTLILGQKILKTTPGGATKVVVAAIVASSAGAIAGIASAGAAFLVIDQSSLFPRLLFGLLTLLAFWIFLLARSLALSRLCLLEDDECSKKSELFSVADIPPALFFSAVIGTSLWKLGVFIAAWLNAINLNPTLQSQYTISLILGITLVLYGVTYGLRAFFGGCRVDLSRRLLLAVIPIALSGLIRVVEVTSTSPINDSTLSSVLFSQQLWIYGTAFGSLLLSRIPKTLLSAWTIAVFNFGLSWALAIPLQEITLDSSAFGLAGLLASLGIKSGSTTLVSVLSIPWLLESVLNVVLFWGLFSLVLSTLCLPSPVSVVLGIKLGVLGWAFLVTRAAALRNILQSTTVIISTAWLLLGFLTLIVLLLLGFLAFLWLTCKRYCRLTIVLFGLSFAIGLGGIGAYFGGLARLVTTSSNADAFAQTGVLGLFVLVLLLFGALFLTLWVGTCPTPFGKVSVLLGGKYVENNLAVSLSSNATGFFVASLGYTLAKAVYLYVEATPGITSYVLIKLGLGILLLLLPQLILWLNRPAYLQSGSTAFVMALFSGSYAWIGRYELELATPNPDLFKYIYGRLILAFGLFGILFVVLLSWLVKCPSRVRCFTIFRNLPLTVVIASGTFAAGSLARALSQNPNLQNLLVPVLQPFVDISFLIYILVNLFCVWFAYKFTFATKNARYLPSALALIAPLLFKLQYPRFLTAPVARLYLFFVNFPIGPVLPISFFGFNIVFDLIFLGLPLIIASLLLHQKQPSASSYGAAIATASLGLVLSGQALASQYAYEYQNISLPVYLDLITFLGFVALPILLIIIYLYLTSTGRKAAVLTRSPCYPCQAPPTTVHKSSKSNYQRAARKV